MVLVAELSKIWSNGIVNLYINWDFSISIVIACRRSMVPHSIIGSVLYFL